MNSLINALHSTTEHRFLLLVSLLMCGIMLVPDLNTIGTETMILVSIICLSTIISYYRFIPDRLKKAISFFVFFVIIIFLYKIIGVSTAWLDIQAGYFNCLVCTIVATLSLMLFSPQQLRKIELFILIETLIVMAYISMTINRSFAVMDLEDAIAQESAAFGSSIMLFAGICLVGFLHTKKIMSKSLYLVGVLASIYVTIYIMQRGTNAIILVLMVTLILMAQFVKRRPLAWTLAVLFIAIALYFSGFFFGLLDKLAEVVPSERLSTRLSVINYYLQTGDAADAGSSMTTRSELLNRSIATVFSSLTSFLFGVGDHRNMGGPVGNHNEIIDTFARYGVFTFIILVSFFVNILKYWREVLRDYPRLCYQITIIISVFIVRNVWGNALTSAISLMMFLFLPLTVHNIVSDKSDNN